MIEHGYTRIRVHTQSAANGKESAAGALFVWVEWLRMFDRPLVCFGQREDA
jgi:hypothetical protein